MNGNIQYETVSLSPAKIVVKLSRKKVGLIQKDGLGWYYAPYGYKSKPAL